MAWWSRRRIVGVALLAIGITALGLTASATLGLLTERDAQPAPEASTSPESSAPSQPGDVASVHVQALGYDLPVSVGVPAAPAQQLGLTHVDTGRDVPLAKLGVDVAPAGGAPADRPAPTTASIDSAHQRIVGPPAQAAALGAAAFASVGLLVYFWGALKAWGARTLVVPAMGLYAKITRAEVFDNAVREGIFSAIRARPGISASELATLAGVSWGTTIYHLEVLEQNRMVTSLRKGRHRRYFENGAELTQSKDVLAILQNPVTATIAETIRHAPGATQKELASATGMTPQALHWHLARLCEAGVVRKERAGRFVKHFSSAN